MSAFDVAMIAGWLLVVSIAVHHGDALGSALLGCALGLSIAVALIGHYKSKRRRRPVRDRLASITADAWHDLDCHVMLILRPIADQMRVWSDPVQFRIIPADNGLVELELRHCEEADHADRR